MSVVLIGMPSCGKSTVGVLLAKKLGYRFIDSDLLIQEKTGMLLHEIIEKRGIDEFLRIEGEVNASIKDERAVIATGGSAIYCHRAMENLSDLGMVVYILISYEEMEKRLGDYQHRGVVMPEGYTLRQMYNERAAYYARYANVVVPGAQDISKTLDYIIKELGY